MNLVHTQRRGGSIFHFIVKGVKLGMLKVLIVVLYTVFLVLILLLSFPRFEIA